MRLSLILFIALSTVSSLTTTASAETRVALVIGNSSYEHASDLSNPKNDADDISQKLIELGFDVVRGTELTVQGFNSKLRTFSRKLRNADVALLFYAGHGIAVDGINYLVPVDAQLESKGALQFEAISLSDIQEMMESRPRTNILIFDACRNNPFTRSISRSLGKSRASRVSNGWASVDPATGTYISFATKPGDVASDGAGRNSPFTEAFLTHMTTPNIDIEVMMKQVRKDVMVATQAAGKRQVPWARSSMVSNFFLNPGSNQDTRKLVQNFISSNKTRYAEGEKIKLYITPPKDCKLTLFNFDKAGRSCQLFPHKSLSDDVLSGGKRFVFPPKGTLTLPEAGQETFVALCNASDTAIAAATRNTRNVGCSNGAADRDFNQKTLELSVFNPGDETGSSPPTKKQTILRSSLTVTVGPK